MVNFLRVINKNDKLYATSFFRQMSLWKKGGLNASNIDCFLNDVEYIFSLDVASREYEIFEKYQLKEISGSEYDTIHKYLANKVLDQTKICWHPKASLDFCSKGKKGKVEVIAAHSIQNNGVLNNVADCGHVIKIVPNENKFKGEKIGIRQASTFYGFCNDHDSVFNPIERQEYTRSDEQNFLFAYRAFIWMYHHEHAAEKIATLDLEAVNDMEVTKDLFNRSILSDSYSILHSEVFEFPGNYPVAGTNLLTVDFDFVGSKIPIYLERTKYLYLTVLPNSESTIVLLSCLKEDFEAYNNLIGQLKNVDQDTLKRYITLLLLHCENVYFNPEYFRRFIEPKMLSLSQYIKAAQGSSQILSVRPNINYFHT